jgi:2-polyprenyl-3-methyl-5-hydroxy-6-metoxy-1,4-benzoquinol methylase
MAIQLIEKSLYMLSGITGRLSGTAECPACGSVSAWLRDRKWFHSLLECRDCGLLHRYPVESAKAMADMYDDGYAQPGLTTELPDDANLARLLETEFRNTEKHFGYHISIFRALGLADGARLLDYGANWGYASWQFSRAGFDVSSYEISQPRAGFGSKLGLKIHTDLSNVGTGFDAVYSCHVLEHTPDPAAALRAQLSLVKPGGLVIGHTPNGSVAFQAKNSKGFHLVWGKVHPVLLTEPFVLKLAEGRPCLVTSDDRPDIVATWDRIGQKVEVADGPGLFFVIRSTP